MCVCVCTCTCLSTCTCANKMCVQAHWCVCLCVCVCICISPDTTLNTLVFDGLFGRMCSLMLLVIHSAMRLRSLSACFCFYTVIHPSTSTEPGKRRRERETEIKSKEENIGRTEELEWMKSLFIYISSRTFRNLRDNVARGSNL